MDMEDLARQHSERFRKVSNRYARRVAEAYEGDIARAAGDTDEQVAANVAAWERRVGTIVRDWHAQGVEEGRDESDWHAPGVEEGRA